MKKKVRKRSTVKTQLKTYFNRHIRLRDCAGQSGGNCITCESWKPFEKLHAGHFVSVGSCSALQFEEQNVHIQCFSCNNMRHGEQAKYLIVLEKRYGRKIVDWLMDKDIHVKKTTAELEELIIIYKNKCKDYEREKM